jgi:hypothetical protein
MSSVLLVLLGFAFGIVACWLILLALGSQWRPPWW